MALSKKRRELETEIAGRDMRRMTTAAVLFHHALAERLGLGPTDLKCYDLLRDGGPMIGSKLAALSGLTTGAVTGVVSRLESAGFVRRAADPTDGRKQVVTALSNHAHAVHGLFRHLHEELSAMLDAYDTRQLATVADFLSRTTELLHRQIAQLRSEHVVAAQPSPQSHSRRHT